MRRILSIVLAVGLSATPALPQDSDSGRSLMEQGMEMFLEGLRDELSPAFRDLQGLMQEAGPPLAEFLLEMGPALAEILEEVEDWTRYEAPEILPNGDIIIRRKPDPEDKPVEAPSEPTDI